MSYRILVEIGHEASIRTKRTPDGFSHDWEIFVRGCDADISHYVDKVVFNLHQTFPKPRRVVKEPPYKVKESGYAGFNLLIEIYLKNSEDPKKITFYYDLHLQPTGPPIYKVQKEKYVFHHPNEEFRQRLLKGGATLINTPSSHSESSREFPGASDEQRSQLVDKPKLGGDMTKKPKARTEETKSNNFFADLFGTPITKTAKVSPDPKLQAIKNSPKNISVKNEKNNAQHDKNSKSNKHSPQKDKPDRSKEKDHSKKNKEDRRSKDKTKERDKSKEKNSKRDKSPSRRSSASPRRSPKRESSPKKSSSPKRVSSPSPKPKFEERNKYDESSSIKEKQNNDSSKSDKKVKKDKRDKMKDRDKDKREHKLHSKEENKNDLEQKESMKNVYKDTNNVKQTKDAASSKDKEQTKVKEKEKLIKQSTDQHQQSSISCRAEIKDSEKHKSVKHEISEKHKHKHKKKDREKSKKDEKERRHDKNKNDKSDTQQMNNASSKTIVSNNESTKILPPSVVNNEIEKENHQNKNNSTPALPNIETSTRERDESSKQSSRDHKLSTNPLNTLIDELSDNESSDSSNHSIKNNSDVRIRNKINSTKSSTNVVDSTPTVPQPPPPAPPVEIQKEFTPSVVTPMQVPSSNEQDKKNDDRVEKTKKSKKHRDKHKSNKSPDKDVERKRKRKSSSKVDDVETSSDKIMNNDEQQPRPMKQVKSERKISEEEKIEQSTADYMCILKDLQHKIMTLQDNSELQRVVQLIAETGQYEITRQTFDFDLCALDRKTVDRLQEFFKAT